MMDLIVGAICHIVVPAQAGTTNHFANKSG
jgi:hypothetical protein